MTSSHEHFTAVTAGGPVTAIPHGVTAPLSGTATPEQLRVEFVRDDIVRLAVSRGGRFDDHPTYAVRSDLEELDVPFTITESGGRVDVATARLTVSIWLDPFRIDIHRADGSVVFETAGTPETGFAGYATLNDAFVLSRRASSDDVVYGLGERTGPQNRRGRDYTMWNVDVLNPSTTGEFTAHRDASDPRSDRTSTLFDPYYMAIPMLYHQDATSGRVAGSFIDNGYRGRYDFTDRDSYTIEFDGGQYTEYVLAGPDIPDILEGYTWLTGRAPLPPLWSLGHHQSRWERYDQSDVESLAGRFRELDIPCDALWLDIEYMDGYRVFTWNHERFPDPDAMLAQLDETGFRTISISDPGVKAEPGYPVFDDAVEHDVLCTTESGEIYIGQVWPGKTAFPDFATEDARRWWGELNAKHVQAGLAGIWNDMNEPATGDVEPYAMRFDHGKSSHERYHNQYALLMGMATVDGLNAAMPDRRTFVLSRAGSAGIQRYAANWMGDNVSNWDHLHMSIAMANGLGLSGQPFVGADIGGFVGDSTPELFARWMQYGALTPFCRNHSIIGSALQYPWSFGEAVLRIARESLKLRYRLLPYIASAFVEATETGAPVQRSLAFAYQYDRRTASIDDQYLFGPHLLVAPVVVEGATARQVYLPAGGWYDWHSDALLEGPQHIVAEAPLHRIPLYVKAGAVIPMLEEAPATTKDLAPRTLELHVFAPVDTSVTSFLQEDDGLTTAALDGARVRTSFTVTREGAAIILRAEVTGDGFDGFVRDSFIVQVHGERPVAASVDGMEAAVDGQRIRIPVGRDAFTLRIEV